jgi:hypothetical protein
LQAISSAAADASDGEDGRLVRSWYYAEPDASVLRTSGVGQQLQLQGVPTSAGRMPLVLEIET